MLEPYFFQYPSDLPPFEPPEDFRIVGYARVAQYTLVKWRLGFGVDGPNGDHLLSESLYRDRTLLGSDRLEGTLPIYEPPTPPDPDEREPTSEPGSGFKIWDLIEPKMGSFGLPPAIAAALRDPANLVLFE